MTTEEYNQKKHECWEEYKRHSLDGEVQWQPVSRYDVFCAAFDRAYALGKQEKDAEGEVMLMCEKSIAQDMAKSAIRSIQIHDFEGNTNASQNLATFNRGIKFALETLFGSKCLPEEPGNFQATCRPDNVDTLEPNVDTSAHHIADVSNMMPSRLYIATQITASLYANCEVAKQFHSIEAIVRKTLDIADTLIIESSKNSDR